MDNSRFIVPCPSMPDNAIRLPDSQVGPPIRLCLSACTSHHASLELIPDPFQARTGAWCSEDVSLPGILPGMPYSEVAAQRKRHRNSP